MSLRKVTWLLTIPALLLAGGLSAWVWLLHSESGARWLFTKLESSIPGSVGSSTISGDLGSGLRLDGLHLDAGSMRVDVETLIIAIDIDLFPPTINLDTLHADNVVVRVLQASDQETVPENNIEGLSLPVPVNFQDIRISGIEYFDLSGDSALIIHSIEAAGSMYSDLVLDRGFVSFPGNDLNLSGRLGLSQLQAPRWELDISAPRLQWPMDDPEPGVRLGSLKLHTSGNWPQFTVDLAGNLELQGLEPARLKLTGNGTGSDFRTDHLSLEGPELSLAATGVFSWKQDLHLLLETDLRRLDPEKWIDGWPENHPVNGDLSVQWSGDELSISSFTLAVAHTPMLATGHGVINTQSGIVDAELNWRDISWPPGNPATVLNSKNGSFLVSGQPEDWKLEGSLDFQAGEFPEGQLRMSGTGDMDSLAVTIHEGTVLGGTLSGEVDWNWTQSQPFSAKLAMDRIDITPLFPRYPGVLNAQLTANGAIEPFRLGVEIQQLDGVINGYPVGASGGFHIQQGHFYADLFNLWSGASTLSLNGGLYESSGIDFAAEIDSLARFSEALAGNLSAKGTLSLDPASPKFIATVSGQQLKFGQIPIDSLTARFGGQKPLQHIVINAFSQDTEIGLEMSISVNDWTDPLASDWNGTLSELRFDHNGDLVFALDQPATVEGDRTQFHLEQACFSGVRDSHMCIGSSWRSPDELSFSANMAALPVSLLELFIDMEVKFTQILSGTMNWSQKAGGWRNGSVRIEISPGVIQEVNGDGSLLETGPGLFAFELDRGQLRKGDLDINFPGSGDIDIDFSVLDLSLGRQSPVQGTARIDLNDIGAVGAIFPLFDTINGMLDVDMSLLGTLSDPDFKGSATLTNGELANLASGFSFSDINLSGEVSEFDRSELKGSFRAGEGNGEISMTIYFENILSPVINLALEGESLTLIDVPDLKVIANPDMELNWQDKTLEINGRLLVPTARLAPSYLPQSSVGQSADVVIVAGELPVVEKDFLQDNAIKFRGNLEVELGKEVVIDFDLAQINVTGRTRFTWKDDIIPIADGGFDATGDIHAYGQFLSITRGRIGFPGIPADNPHLNIRAEREIFGNAQIRRAGLMVAGTLRRPVIEAYTVPMTNKHRAQTLLVTGSDFNYEQGVGAVDVGMYVLPRLYVSYGIGVFEEGNVLKARYDIGKGFGIRATSGQRETGLDISYTIER